MVDGFKHEILNSNEYRHEYIELTMRLVAIMVEYCMLTLEQLMNKKGGPLTLKEIENVVNFDLQFRIQQIHDPEFMEIIRDKTVVKFLERQEDCVRGA